MIEKNEAKVFCGGLSPDTTEDKLKAQFEPNIFGGSADTDSSGLAIVFP